MARLIHERHQIVQYLRGHHVIGRDPQYADLTLHTAGCSRLHALIEWSGKHWQIKDMSRNGTWVNEEKMPANEVVRLRKGEQIRFGGLDTEPWLFDDASPPSDLLVSETQGTKTLELEDYVLLPSEDNSHTLLYDQERAGWVLYSSDTPNELGGPYTHGNEVIVGRHRWRLFLANAHSLTPLRESTPIPMSAVHLVMHISRDEETTHISATCGNSKHDLGDRAHNYLIAHLARLRAEEMDAGVDSQSAGWIDKDFLSRTLGMSANHLNLQLHRAEKHVCDSLSITPTAAHRLFEKQRGRVRFGSSTCEIYKGEQFLTGLSDN